MKIIIFVLAISCSLELALGSLSDCVDLIQELKKYKTAYDDFKECLNLISNGPNQTNVSQGNTTVLGSKTIGQIKSLYEQYEQYENNTSCSRLHNDLQALTIPEDEFMNCFQMNLDSDSEEEETKNNDEETDAAAENGNDDDSESDDQQTAEPKQETEDMPQLPSLQELQNMASKAIASEASQQAKSLIGSLETTESQQSTEIEEPPSLLLPNEDTIPTLPVESVDSFQSDVDPVESVDSFQPEIEEPIEEPFLPDTFGI